MENNQKKVLMNKIFITLTIVLALVIVFLALFILLDTWNDFSDYFLLLIGALMIAIGLVTIKNRRILSIIYLASGIIVIIGFFIALFINPSFIIG
ncbi:MAG: hypothetical protein E7180_05440 [Erysipelotrichaceae bacterium]|nr:hypothetical protein [Erysipelotrichaceae bacterium]